MISVRVRGLIIDQGEILLCQLAKVSFYSLPGGKMEPGELREETLARELYEELLVKPEIGDCVYTHEFLTESGGKQTTVVEFWYTIKNPGDFRALNYHDSSHGFELSDCRWFDKEELREGCNSGAILPQSMFAEVETYMTI